MNGTVKFFNACEGIWVHQPEGAAKTFSFTQLHWKRPAFVRSTRATE